MSFFLENGLFRLQYLTEVQRGKIDSEKCMIISKNNYFVL
jgi:hypothetical protein